MGGEKRERETTTTRLEFLKRCFHSGSKELPGSTVQLFFNCVNSESNFILLLLLLYIYTYFFFLKVILKPPPRHPLRLERKLKTQNQRACVQHHGQWTLAGPRSPRGGGAETRGRPQVYSSHCNAQGGADFNTLAGTCLCYDPKDQLSTGMYYPIHRDLLQCSLLP